jgi:hypothetical protein
MQKTSFLTPLLAVALFVLAIYTIYSTKESNKKIETLQKLFLEQQAQMPIPETKLKKGHHDNHENHAGHKTGHDHEEEEFPLGDYMGKLLYYTHKLGVAGKYQNWDLANFYLHELEETTEFLVKSNITDEGIAVSKLIEGIEPAIEQVEKSVKEKNAVEFPATYQGLIRSCNNCHISANKPYIVVEALQKDLDGQKFKK